MVECLHCATDFSPKTPGEKFCCRGCEFVYGTIHEQGFDQFYALKGDTQGIPVKDRPFRPQELSWLPPLLEKANEEEYPQVTLRLSGITCIGCVWLIEKLFLRHPGSAHCSVFPATSEIELQWKKGSDPVTKLAQELPGYGYALSDRDESQSHPRESRQLLARLGICGAFALNAMGFTLPRYLGMTEDFAFAGIFELIALLSATFSLLIGGSYFFVKSFTALKRRTLHIDLPISLGLILAYLGSLAGWTLGVHELIYFDFVAIFTFLMLGGRYLHLAAAEKARSSLQGQSALPSSVTLADNNTKGIRSLEKNDTFILEPGQCLPVSSFLHGKSTDFSLAWMTGEPEPQTFGPGRRIPSGALNLSQRAITVTADENFQDSLAAKLSQSVDRETNSPLLTRILKFYLSAVLVIGVVGGLYWLQTGIVPALQVALSVFVVSCPCALGVAIPMADRRAALSLQKQGVFIQNPDIWARLRHIRHLVLDKTGTLTLENPKLSNPEALDDLCTTAERVLWKLTGQSLHPLSRSLHESLAKQALDHDFTISAPVHEEPGQGLSLAFGHHRWFFGKPKTKEQSNKNQNPTAALYRDDHLVTQFYYEEALRPDVQKTLSDLRAYWSIVPHLFSGDQSSRVSAVARETGIATERAHGDLSPEEKAKVLQTLDHTLYLGDGANDSLAFDIATVSGSPVADRSLLDRKADFLFTHPSLNFLPSLLAAAQWRSRTVRNILTFAISYNSLAISLCLMGHMNPLLAAILMPVSSLLSLALASTSLRMARPHCRDKRAVPPPRSNSPASGSELALPPDSTFPSSPTCNNSLTASSSRSSFNASS